MATTKKTKNNKQKTGKFTSDELTDMLKVAGAKYNTLDTEIYKTSLDAMTINELYNEALRVGLKAYGERSLTTRTLIDLFNQYRAQHLPSYYSSSEVNAHLTEEKKAEILNLMRDGK